MPLDLFQMSMKLDLHFEQLIKKYPFEYHTLPFSTRCEYLISIVKELNEFENKKAELKSGLCVISNNAFKEFEIFVIAKGRFVKKTHLKFEEMKNLRALAISPDYSNHLTLILKIKIIPFSLQMKFVQISKHFHIG